MPPRPPSTKKGPDLIERKQLEKKQVPQEKLMEELQETEKSLKNFMKILKDNIREQRKDSDSRAPSAIRPPKK